MSNVLVINSSVLREASVSRTVVQKLLAQLVFQSPKRTVVERDLGTTPVPHLTDATVAGVRGVPTTDAELQARALSDELIGELRKVDIILIGAPMYNFGLPTGLRAWFDHILRAGETFAYSAAGPKGLVEGKRAVVVVSRGGFYSEGPYKPFDFQEPYIRQLLGFIGITDVTFIRAEKIGLGPQAREEAIAGALRAVAQLALPQASEAA